MIKKYWRSQFKWLFLSSILESIGANLFGIVLLMMIAANFTGAQRGWLITAASIVNIMPAVLSAVTGYYADRTANKITVSRIIRCCQMVLYLIIAFYAQSLSIATMIIILLIISVVKLGGGYAGGLLYEKEIQVVAHQDREQIMAWSSGVTSTIAMVAQFIGPALLVLVHDHYGYFALLNAVIFGISALLLGNLRDTPKAIISPESTTQDNQSQISFLDAIRTIFSIPLLGWYISVYTVAGIVGAALENVLSLYFANYHQQQIISFGFTIALVGAVFSVAEVCGAFLPLTIFKKISFLQLIGLQVIFLLGGVIVVELFLPTYLFLTFLFLAGFLQGKAGPKLSAWIMNQDITEHVALSLGLISASMTFTLPIGQLIFMSIANIWSVPISLGLMAFYMGILLLYIGFIIKKTSQRALA